MTRKTKEEKKLAEYRRRLKLQRQISLPDNKLVTNQTVTEEKTKIKVKINEDTSKGLNKYFRKDLKKSLFFILLIITLEIVIYFVRIKI